MKEFKGTQGEWEINKKASVFPIIELQTEYRRLNINCSLYSKETSGYRLSNGVYELAEKNIHFSKENKANAKLIAAAPDMLKVLQKILEYNLEEVYPGFNKDTGIEEVINKALE